MTKQKEIEDIICGVIRHWNQTSISANWQPLYGGITMPQDIMLGLHSQGVVIKVDRKLPLVYVKKAYGQAYAVNIPKTIKDLYAGYVAVEPLIKEEPNEEK